VKVNQTSPGCAPDNIHLEGADHHVDVDAHEHEEHTEKLPGESAEGEEKGCSDTPEGGGGEVVAGSGEAPVEGQTPAEATEEEATEEEPDAEASESEAESAEEVPEGVPPAPNASVAVDLATNTVREGVSQGVSVVAPETPAPE